MLDVCDSVLLISNPAIFLWTFNFTVIAGHNIMASNLESHAMAIKFCFDMR